MYCDDTSGNLSKKWNEHNSFLFTAAGLPRTEAQKEFNIHFLSTSNIAPPLEMLDGIVEQLEPVFQSPLILHLNDILCLSGSARRLVSGPGTVPRMSPFFSFLRCLLCLVIIPCRASLPAILVLGVNYFAEHAG